MQSLDRLKNADFFSGVCAQEKNDPSSYGVLENVNQLLRIVHEFSDSEYRGPGFPGGLDI